MEVRKPGFARRSQSLGIHEADHQHRLRRMVDDHRGQQSLVVELGHEVAAGFPVGTLTHSLGLSHQKLRALLLQDNHKVDPKSDIVANACLMIAKFREHMRRRQVRPAHRNNGAIRAPGFRGSPGSLPRSRGCGASGNDEGWIRGACWGAAPCRKAGPVIFVTWRPGSQDPGRFVSTARYRSCGRRALRRAASQNTR